ncbi:hypothetical protein V6N11_012561 [Hibiscus sabdariffa]|uniref:Uncharacterized protein n=1 Tax=Hibiscus sabdariffa TaxID=183260 RepID=A0ABR2QBS6_9ROSI
MGLAHPRTEAKCCTRCERLQTQPLEAREASPHNPPSRLRSASSALHPNYSKSSTPASITDKPTPSPVR